MNMGMMAGGLFDYGCLELAMLRLALREYTVQMLWDCLGSREYELVDGRNLEELNSKVKDAYGRILVHDASVTKSQAKHFFEP
jgi:hypothetical protein